MKNERVDVSAGTTGGCSRRVFLGGVFGSVAIAGCRSIAPSFAGAKANLKIGIVSDIHLCSEDGDFLKFGDASVFKHALEWFRDQGVDGVVLPGDIADNGMIAQLRKAAEAWNEVFPGDRAPDGRRVEKLFVYGNHDLEGQTYDGYEKRFFIKEPFEKGQIATDPAKAWEEVFGEPYSPIWMKTVKGYQFIGAHWIRGRWDGIAAVEPWFEEHADEIDRTKPFFFIQHPHPNGTCFGPTPFAPGARAWGEDKGYATRALSKFPNAVAFSGHAHQPATDDRFIWQGAFTSIGLPSLRYCSTASARSLGGARASCPWPEDHLWRTRQGMLLEVYDTEMVLKCRDFENDEFVRDDTVIPLPLQAERPFGFEARAEASDAPVWPAGAALSVSRDGDNTTLSFPSASGKTLTVGYVVETEGIEEGKPARVFIYQPGYDRARGHVPAEISETFEFKEAKPGAKISVVPLNCFGRRGAALEA